MLKRIFISHANSDTASDHFLHLLCDRLREGGMDVLIDRERLQPGAVWRREIYTWLSVCHAAIVLLSRRALEEDSIWVPRETSLLMWRKALDPKLMVIPVLCEGVTLEDVERDRRFHDLQIRELQTVSLDEADRSAMSVVSSLGRLAPDQRTPFDELVNFIAPLLAGIEPEHLDVAATLTNSDLPGLRGIGDPGRRVAYAMLSCDLETLRPMFDYLFSRARSSARADLADVLAILGANWVDIEAAQWIARESASRLAGRHARALLLNASSLFAAEMYVQRASGRPPHARWPLVPVTGVSGSETSAEILDEIEHALSTQMPLPPDPFENDPVGRRRRQLERMRRMGVPLFFVMRLPPNARNLVRSIEARYRDANPLFLTGDDPPDPEQCPEDLFRFLSPPLDAGVEFDAQSMMDFYRSAYGIH